MSPIPLKDRQRINHELKTLGFGGLEDCNILAQIATLYTTHEAFRGLLMSTASNQRQIAYDSLRSHLRFVAKPLDVYEREAKDRAEREQWDVYDGTPFPKPFKVPEIESEEYKLQKLAADAIEQAEHEKAKGRLELVCTKCTLAGYFPAQNRKQAIKAGHDAGWRWDERNGVKRTYCPKDVPGRATMRLECGNDNCGKVVKLRVWDEQDGYRDARLLGWEIADKCKCPRCAAKLVMVQ